MTGGAPDVKQQQLVLQCLDSIAVISRRSTVSAAGNADAVQPCITV